MTVKVNLLPEPYQRNRRHDRRCRVGMVVAVTLLVVELGAGLTLHLRADKTRTLLAQAEEARLTTRAIEHKLAEPTHRWELVSQQVALATRLRATHRWSRLLAMLADATPEKVVLMKVSTQPPKWSPDLAQRAQGQPRRNAGDTTDVKRTLEGVAVRGYAADHDDLANLMAAIQASKAFASLDLLEARRDTFMGQEAIAFEIKCLW